MPTLRQKHSLRGSKPKSNVDAQLAAGEPRVREAEDGRQRLM
jgi:hypothetical protein